MREHDLGIIVPLREEFRVLEDLCPISDNVFHDAIHYYFLEMPNTALRTVALVLGEMGTTPAGQITEKMLAFTEVETLVLIGIAGSIDKDLKLGDIVVASEVCEFQAAAKAVPKGRAFAFRYSGRNWTTDVALRRCAAELEFSDKDLYDAWQSQVRNYRDTLGLTREQASLASGEPGVQVGHIASGDTVAAAKAYAVELLGIDRKFAAIEMEAAGVMQAAYGRESPARVLVCRGISDFADERKKELDLVGNGVWRKYAMHNATTFLLNLLRAESVSGIISGNRPVHSGSILVVEDNDAVRRSLEKELERAGYVVHAVSGPEKARQMLESTHVDLVLLDLELPNMIGELTTAAGLSLLGDIKQQYPYVEVIMLTGHATVESAVEALRIGAFDYIVKAKISSRDLLAKVEKDLGSTTSASSHR